MKRTIYLVLKEPILNQQKEKAKKEAAAIDESYEKEGAMVWEEIILQNSEENIDYEVDPSDNSLRVWGDFNNKMGFISIDIPLTFEMVSEIIEMYVKKINKVKTILEAAK